MRIVVECASSELSISSLKQSWSENPEYNMLDNAPATSIPFDVDVDILLGLILILRVLRVIIL